jgi:hypothetical protein
MLGEQPSMKAAEFLRAVVSAQPGEVWCARGNVQENPGRTGMALS